MKNTYFLRRVNKSDMLAVFNLSNESYVRKFSIQQETIQWEQHMKWFENLLSSPDTFFYVVTNQTNIFHGQIRYKVDNNTATISISFTKSILGKGLSAKLVAESMYKLVEDKPGLDYIIAYVDQENIASKRLFENVGFQQVDNQSDLLEFRYLLR